MTGWIELFLGYQNPQYIGALKNRRNIFGWKQQTWFSQILLFVSCFLVIWWPPIVVISGTSDRHQSRDDILFFLCIYLYYLGKELKQQNHRLRNILCHCHSSCLIHPKLWWQLKVNLQDELLSYVFYLPHSMLRQLFLCSLWFHTTFQRLLGIYYILSLLYDIF